MSNLESIEGERGMADVNSRTTSPAMKGFLIVLAVVVVVSALVGLWFYKYGSLFQSEPKEEKKEVTATSSVSARTFGPIVEPKPEPELAPAVKPIVPRPVATPPVDKPGPPPVTFDRAGGGMMVYQGDTRRVAAAMPQGGGDTPSGNPLAGLGGGSDLSSNLTPTKLRASSASMLGDRNFILTKGNYIDCGLDSRLDSTVPGVTSCTVSRDVYSANGNVKLVDRGSKIFGEYQSSLQQGQNLIHVLWNRIESPTGVIIDINSPAAGQLGETGVAGHVNNHFWKRFGGAILISLIDGAVQVGTKDSTSDGDVFIGGTADTAGDLATEVLRNTINIPPTLYTNQGARVGVYLARDLDFSDVYDLEVQ